MVLKLLIITLLFTFLLILFGAKFIKKYAIFFYCIALALSLESIASFILNLYQYQIAYPSILNNFFICIDKGILATALFIWVMFSSVWPRKLLIFKRSMLCRGEISIIASILIMPHIAHYTYLFINNLSHLNRLKGVILWGTFMGFVAGMFAFLIMLPLFITSFKNIRKLFSGKSWKNLQSYAYLFYAFVFFHIVAEWFSKSSDQRDLLSFITYSFVFVLYSILRAKKHAWLSYFNISNFQKEKGHV